MDGFGVQPRRFLQLGLSFVDLKLFRNGVYTSIFELRGSGFNREDRG